MKPLLQHQPADPAARAEGELDVDELALAHPGRELAAHRVERLALPSQPPGQREHHQSAVDQQVEGAAAQKAREQPADHRAADQHGAARGETGARQQAGEGGHLEAPVGAPRRAAAADCLHGWLAERRQGLGAAHHSRRGGRAAHQRRLDP